MQDGSAADRDAAAFFLTADEVRLFGVSCLGGSLDASTTLLQAGGLTLRQGLAAPSAVSSSGSGSSNGVTGRSGSRAGSASAGSQRSRGGSRQQAAGRRSGIKAAEAAPVLLSCAADAGLDVVHVQRCGCSAFCCSLFWNHLSAWHPSPHPMCCNIKSLQASGVRIRLSSCPVVVSQRQGDMMCVCCRPATQAGAAAVEAAASIVLRGVTLATDPATQPTAASSSPHSSSPSDSGSSGNLLTAEWPAQLASVFVIGGEASPEAASATQQQQRKQQPATTWTVSLQVLDLCLAW